MDLLEAGPFSVWYRIFVFNGHTRTAVCVMKLPTVSCFVGKEEQT